MAFGFVVARFGLFLRLLRVQAGEAATHGVSPILGAALVLIGALATAAGAVQYRRFTARLAPAELPSPRAAVAPLTLAWSLVGVGLVLVLVLLL
jgi:putative membrane protein